MSIVLLRTIGRHRIFRFATQVIAARAVLRWLVTHSATAWMVVLVACGGDLPEQPGSPLIARVVVSAVPEPLLIGQTRAMTASLRSPSDQEITGLPISWESVEPTIATVSASGVVEGRGAGVVVIRAKGGGKVGETTVTVVAPAPLPELLALTPSELQVGTTTDVTITVTGAHFREASVVRLDGTALSTSRVSATQLTAVVPPSAMSTVGVRSVTVFTPDVGATAALPIRIVLGPAPAPTMTDINPAEIRAGYAQPFRIEITGTGFTPQSQVTFDNVPVLTEYTSSTRLWATVQPEAVRVARNVVLAVTTPAPGGGVAQRTFTVAPIVVARVEVLSPNGGAWTWTRDGLRLTAIARDALDRELTDRTAQWFSLDESIAWPNANADGRTASVYGVKVGTTRVGARFDGAYMDRTVTVVEAPTYDLAFVLPINGRRRLGIWQPGLGQGHTLVRVPEDVYEVAPSPTGAWIIYSGKPEGSGVDGNVDLYLTNRDASITRRLTTHPATDYEPSWSPDGLRVAFTSTRDGLRDVWVMNVDGSGATKLTEALGGAGFPHSGNGAGSPAWSPDGSQIAYVVGTQGTLNTPPMSTIWVMNADGSGKRRLTNGAEGNDFTPTWSPDGQLVAFNRVWRANNTQQLVAVSASTGATAFPWLHNAFIAAGTPSYSPDGKWVTVSYLSAGDNAPLYVLANDNSVAPRIITPATVPAGVLGAKWMRRRP